MERKNLFKTKNNIYRGEYEFYYTSPSEGPGVMFDTTPVSEEYDESTGDGLWTFDDPPTAIICSNQSGLNHYCTYMSLPTTITYIGDGACRNIYSNLYVDVDFSNVTYVGDIAFESANISNFPTFENGVNIGSSAFVNCTFGNSNIANLYIYYAENSSIGYRAFYNSNIAGVDLIHNDLSSTDLCTVGSEAFEKCSVTTVYISPTPFSRRYRSDSDWQATGLNIQ